MEIKIKPDDEHVFDDKTEDEKLIHHLASVKQGVENVLEQYPEARNSDNLLLLLFWKEYCGLDVKLDFTQKLTPFESIRRMRQKLNAEGRYLATDKDVLEFRDWNAKMMRKNIKDVD